MSLRPEEIDHINLVNWFNYTFPELEPDFHHFANERYLDVKKNPKLWNTANKLKSMGVKKGVADFFLAIPLNGKAGLWLELKVGRNKPSKEQIDFGARKVMRHYEFAFVWGFEAAKTMIETYLKDYIANSEKIMLISCT